MDSIPQVASYITCVTGLAIIIFLLVWFCRTRPSFKKPLFYSPIVFTGGTIGDKLRKEADSLLPTNVTVNLSSVTDVNDKLIEEFAKWGKLIARDYLADDQLISRGHFACVFKSILSLPGKEAITVVTKVTTVNSTKYTQDFICHAQILVSIDHLNLLPLIGLIFNQDRLPYLVYPYVANGDLHAYLSNRSNQISYPQMIKFSLDIATGMQYLIEHGVFHRNLAARNCFLDDSYNVLVGDYAFTTIKYNRAVGRKSALCKGWRWQSFEVLDGQIFTEKSDVYSFAVTVWEILTLGLVPFSSLKDSEVKKHMKQLKTVKLDQPDGVSDDLYSLLTQCWSFNASGRPTFSTVTLYLSQMYSDHLGKVTFSSGYSDDRYQSNYQRNGVLPPVPEEDDEYDDEVVDEASHLNQQ